MVAQLAALSQFSGMLEHLRQTELYSHLSFLEEENFSYPPPPASPTITTELQVMLLKCNL